MTYAQRHDDVIFSASETSESSTLQSVLGYVPSLCITDVFEATAAYCDSRVAR